MSASGLTRRWFVESNAFPAMAGMLAGLTPGVKPRRRLRHTRRPALEHGFARVSGPFADVHASARGRERAGYCAVSVCGAGVQRSSP
ncbi:hypothetical protein Hoch_2588 [Haliangium ochraceum DSM 14365]|uniref:Uncharacterized protein n=1 Tax=Haliangium ochraceum (strain DSM 14365 / JCM 11303 / SMP-2) TaxID=502025 RepID=D0LLU4_HALO1|nr:hypothetical protein Hoch_2588 [Haliangium ochraceum DSM 14365]